MRTIKVDQEEYDNLSNSYLKAKDGVNNLIKMALVEEELDIKRQFLETALVLCRSINQTAKLAGLI